MEHPISKSAVARPETIKSSMTINPGRVGLRSYISSWMLRSARRFTDMAQAIEDEHLGEWASPHVEEHMDYVIAAVMGSATFMEAMINELFTDASDGHGLKGDGYLVPLSADTLRLMKDWWDETDQGMDRPLTKYQLLLTFAGQSKLDPGAEPYQSAKLLIRLRNDLVHYRPETIYTDETHKLEKQLKNRFPSNGLIKDDGGRWPNGLLGAGCARWSTEVARALADDVVGKIGITPNYIRVLAGRGEQA